jgi:phage terminase small subunit
LALTPKQQAFADYYIECGNATEAAKRAGYSENNVGENAAKTLKNPNVSAYIAERMEEQTKKRVADANEVIEFYTAVMRGEVKDQFGLDASLSDRLKAGDSLMKRYMAGGYKYGETKREEDPLSKALREEAERMQNEDTE